MRPVAIFAVLLAVAATASAQVAIEVGSATAPPGGVATVGVMLATQRADVAGTGNSVRWSGPFSIAGCRVNPEIQRPASVFSYAPTGCASSETCSSLRAIVLALSLSPPPLADGALLYTCDAVVRLDATPGEYLLQCAAPEAATSGGADLAVDCVDGVLTVSALPPTATASATQSAVASATPPPPTATPVPCPGDCDGDGRVSIDELVLSVRIALARADVASCRAASADGDPTVSIAELVGAVGAALQGCG